MEGESLVSTERHTRIYSLNSSIAAFPVEWKENPNGCVKQVHKITSKFHTIIIFIGKPSRVHAKEAVWQLEQQHSRRVDREFPVLLVCYTNTSMLNNWGKKSPLCYKPLLMQ